MGHVIQLRREGIKASAPMFIPFLGALVAMKEMPKDAAAEARVGPRRARARLARRARCRSAIYALTGDELFKALAFVGFFLNLFNLLPVLPLDGGRAMAALSPWMWFVGFGLLVAATFVFPNPIMLLILLFGGLETWRRWKARNEPARARVPPGPARAHARPSRPSTSGLPRSWRWAWTPRSSSATSTTSRARCGQRPVDLAALVRALRSRRLSRMSLPWASAISTFALGPLKYMRVGTRVRPRSAVLPISRSISRRCSSSLRGRSGSWLLREAGLYGAMYMFCSQTSPSRTSA